MVRLRNPTSLELAISYVLEEKHFILNQNQFLYHNNNSKLESSKLQNLKLQNFVSNNTRYRFAHPNTFHQQNFSLPQTHQFAPHQSVNNRDSMCHNRDFTWTLKFSMQHVRIKMSMSLNQQVSNLKINQNLCQYRLETPIFRNQIIKKLIEVINLKVLVHVILLSEELHNIEELPNCSNLDNSYEQD